MDTDIEEYWTALRCTDGSSNHLLGLPTLVALTKSTSSALNCWMASSFLCCSLSLSRSLNVSPNAFCTSFSRSRILASWRSLFSLSLSRRERSSWSESYNNINHWSIAHTGLDGSLNGVETNSLYYSSSSHRKISKVISVSSLRYMLTGR